MRAPLLALALVLAVPALSACSGEEATADEASLSAQDANKHWQDAAEKALGTEIDLESLQRQAAIDCQNTDVANWVVTLGTSGDTATAGTDLIKLGLQNVCPEVEDTFNDALGQVQDSQDVMALVCAQPVAKLDSVSRMKYDFMC